MTRVMGSQVKSVERAIADSDQPASRLRRDLGGLDLVVLGVAVVIGAGIFTLAASTAGNVAGPSVSLAFVISALACGLAALCYAELSATVPVAGSAYTFSYTTLGELIAWIIGWDIALEFTIGGAVVAKGWSQYLAEVIGLTGAHQGTATLIRGSLRLDWAALLIVAATTVVLAARVKLSSRVSQVITAVKIGVVLLVVVVGLGYVRAANYAPFIPPPRPSTPSASALDQSVLSLLNGGASSTFGWYGLLAAASIVFFAFIGFDIVATTAEETRNPQRDLPRGIIGSLVVVTILYVAVSLVLTGMVPYTELATPPDGRTATLATAFALNGAHWAAAVISIGALAGLTTVILVVMLGQTRVLFAMSRDGLLPPALARTGTRGTPVRMTLMVGALVGLVAALLPADKLVEMVNIGTLFAFVLVSTAVVVLRRTRPELPRPFRTPLVPLIPILAVLACGWLMLNLTALTWLRFLAWLVLGLAVYLGYGRRHSRLRIVSNSFTYSKGR